MEKIIDELINEYKKQIENNMKYIKGEWACEADRISEMKVAVDVLRKVVKDLQLLKSSLPTTEFTELQAWKKIAEVTDTDEPKFNPADFYHDIRILFKNANFSVPIRGDKTLYDNGYRIVHESSLPIQQDKVVVPRFVAEYLEMRKEQFPVGGLGVAIIHVFDGKGSPELFNWMNSNTEVFARAWLDGCTVEKEQMYEVRLPYEQWDEDSAEVKTEVAILAYDNTSDETKFVSSGTKFFSNNHKTKLSEERIKLIDDRYWTFAVPVEEEE